MSAPAPTEDARAATIAQYALDEVATDPDLREIVEVAASICGVPRAAINILDTEHQRQIAAVGFEPATRPRADSMCAVVLDRPEAVVVQDASADARFVANPFVSGELDDIRLYASSPLTAPNGVVIGRLCVFDSVAGELSEDKRRALDTLARHVVEVFELRRVSAELRESNARLEEFAARVSHDLRNPLMALTGFIELAADSPELHDAPHVAHALARADAAATRMAAMISELLDYSRLGGTTIGLHAVDLPEVIRGALEDLHDAIVRGGARVVVDADATVLGDATMLRTLVENLVANAIKFTAATGASPLVEIDATTRGGWCRLTVDDNGPGIAPAQRERVFELMERGDAGDVPGLGIGLSTCRAIVHAHHGRITIEDSPAGGTRVRVMLPRAT